MAKKIVRGITDVKTINNQDFDTNNVNDLLSDGQYNYIHRKKGKGEEYHNLTDNIKTLSSDNTELLSVTNNNKTTNTATLHPKHDKQKEQVLESTRNTVNIQHGTNGTAEKTSVDTNPQKVLEHENLLTDYGISKTTSGNTTKLGIEYTLVDSGFDLNNFERGNVRCTNFVNAPKDNTFFFVSAYKAGNNIIQEATELFTPNNDKYVRKRINSEWGEWREQIGDKSVIDGLLAQKQDKLTAGDGITIQGNTISASAPTPNIQEYSFAGGKIRVIQHIVFENEDFTFTTFTFDCYPQATEELIPSTIKEDFEYFFKPNKSISNGALTISNDGTTMKLLNSAPSENVRQQATFTFFEPKATIGG